MVYLTKLFMELNILDHPIVYTTHEKTIEIVDIYPLDNKC